MDYRRFIAYEPGKRGGKPCIRGLRMTMYDVLDYLASGMTPEQIVTDFDYLSSRIFALASLTLLIANVIRSFLRREAAV
jgi:uncharacterized protein (DUF433 family)